MLDVQLVAMAELHHSTAPHSVLSHFGMPCTSAPVHTETARCNIA
jgi:hypothetical protein